MSVCFGKKLSKGENLMVNIATKKKEEKQPSKVVGKIPINDDTFKQILINIGRAKKQ